jgi:predicted TPR repeat methyltransferase
MALRYDLDRAMTGGPLFVSSGDAIADGHYRSALERIACGDLVGAAEILARTVEFVPAFATAWFALGAIRDNLGDRAGAIAAWQRAHDADPDDYHGARLQLARLGAGDGTPAMTATYVRRLFDQQAASFDETLTERLDYRGPEILLEVVRGIAGPRLRIGSMLDLGCGTGLGGAAFRPHVDWLVGVDVSPAMIAKAREKGLYDRLAVDDLRRFLDAEANAHPLYHLVLAADVLVYMNDLAPVAAAAARVLAPAGVLAFTVEAHAGGGVVLQPTLRYAHGQAHVRGAIADAGLELLRLSDASTRTEKGAAVAGLVVVASKPAASAAATVETH